MKVLFLSICLIYASGISALERGTYVAYEGNNSSICLQQVKPLYVSGNLVSIKIAYVGDCGYWGPFIYSCDGGVCTDGTITVSIFSETEYLWTNIDYEIWGKFHKIPQK